MPPSPATLSFESLGVRPSLARALAAAFAASAPTPAQRALLPAIIAHRSVILKDVTGSGKTLAAVAAVLAKQHPSVFTRPGSARPIAVESILDRPAIPAHLVPSATQVAAPTATDDSPLVNQQKLALLHHRYLTTLILVPTRDLAVQITTWIRDLITHIRMQSASDPNALAQPNHISFLQSEPEESLFQCVVSGIPIETQQLLLQKTPPRILIGTPARLFDLYQRKAFDTSRLQLLLVDEIDRVIDVQKRYDTVKSKFIRHIHPLSGELLMRFIIKERTDMHRAMHAREELVSPLAAAAAAAAAAASSTAFKPKATHAQLHQHKRAQPSPKTAAKTAAKTATDGTIRYDPAQAKPLQIVAISATANSNVKFHLTQKNKWMNDAVVLDMNNVVQSPVSISHHVYIVDKFGHVHLAVDPQDFPEKDATSAVSSDAASSDASDASDASVTTTGTATSNTTAARVADIPAMATSSDTLIPHESIPNIDLLDGDIYTTPEEERLAIESHVWPDDHDLVVQALAGLIHRDHVQRAFVFVQSSVSVTRLVQRLRDLGVKADKMINLVDYAGATIGRGVDCDGDRDGQEVSGDGSNTTTTTSDNTTTTSDNTTTNGNKDNINNDDGVSNEIPDAVNPPTQQLNPAKPNTTRPFARFHSGDIQLIVATEHEARGLDLPTCTHVYILGIPSSHASYVHMAGRVGRFGRNGSVTTVLGGPRYWNKMNAMLKLIGVRASDPEL